MVRTTIRSGRGTCGGCDPHRQSRIPEGWNQSMVRFSSRLSHITWSVIWSYLADMTFTLPPPPVMHPGPIPRGYQILPYTMTETETILPHDRYWSIALKEWHPSNFVGKKIPAQHRTVQDVYIRRKCDFKIKVSETQLIEP